ncbi:hypothetical protein ACLI2C_16290, partial [Enterococcus faecalis]|uniref:hypothetical protein n=1 Tax=Enterococcus faecalis TaxID=1351 RepID=UPI00398859DB
TDKFLNKVANDLLIALDSVALQPSPQLRYNTALFNSVCSFVQYNKLKIVSSTYLINSVLYKYNTN